MTQKTIAIVGGGASGLAAAISAGRAARAAAIDVDIAIYEADERVGRSILRTGNGRCNFSSLRIDMRDYRNPEFVSEVLTTLEGNRRPFNGVYPGQPFTREDNDAVHRFFEEIGLDWYDDASGREYPSTNKASTVLDVLRNAARQFGVREECGQRVAVIEPPRSEGARFTLRMADGVFQRADAVIVACGGQALTCLDAFDLPIEPMTPVLGPLACKETSITRALDNIRVKCNVMLARDYGDETWVIRIESGELLFRKYGVSGICVFNLSRLAQPGDGLRIDFLGMSEDGFYHEDAVAFMQKRAEHFEKTFGVPPTFEDLLRGLVLPRVADAVLNLLDEDDTLDDLVWVLTYFPLTITGIGDEKVCQVHRGGLAVEACDSETMQIKDIPGLYVAGEALDVDGPCGGYNLHWAWASGLLAGKSAVQRLRG